MVKIKSAILSCYNKTGLVDMATLLREFDVDLLCTQGTLGALKSAGIAATSIGEYSGVEEMLDGRVKSLHPKIHAGLLGIRDNKLHTEQMQAHDYRWVDFVAVNFHPLDEMIRTPGITAEEVIDQIDIGGTAMVRSAAKNFRYVTVVVNPARYKSVMHEMHELGGGVSFVTRYRLAQEAFEYTAKYDAFISEYLRSTEPPKE